MGAPRQLYPLFMDAYSRATALTEGTPELRSHRAHALHMFERKFALAESQLLQVEREKPTLTRVYQLLAMLYVSTGRFDDAIASLDRGYKVDPLWPVFPAVELSVRFFARDFEAAIACGRKSVELHPYVQVGRFFYALSLEYSGRVEEALREYRMGFVLSPGFVWPRVLEAICLTKVGKRSEAKALLSELETIRMTEYVDACYFAFAYEALGMRDRAFQELERARTENSITLCLIDVDPRMDSMREDVRFQRLRKQVFSQAESFSPSDSSQKLSAPA
jgi:tetratricopeptide (TPR) repeat protein